MQGEGRPADVEVQLLLKLFDADRTEITPGSDKVKKDFNRRVLHRSIPSFMAGYIFRQTVQRLTGPRLLLSD